MDLILYDAAENIARITLNRPGKRNALNAELISDLLQALAQATADETIRVVLIAGAGQDFCAGMDLMALDRGNDAGTTDHLATARNIANVLLAIRKHRCPVIAAVQGRALGGGAGIASACDLVLASESAAIGYPEVNLGFVPAVVAALLRNSVTEKRLFEILVSGVPLPAKDAQAAGIINQVFPDAEFSARVDAYARNLAQKSASALSLTKSLLHHTESMTLEQAMEAGVYVNALARTTEDAKRGFAGFLNKKP